MYLRDPSTFLDTFFNCILIVDEPKRLNITKAISQMVLHNATRIDLQLFCGEWFNLLRGWYNDLRCTVIHSARNFDEWTAYAMAVAFIISGELKNIGRSWLPEKTKLRTIEWTAPSNSAINSIVPICDCGV